MSEIEKIASVHLGKAGDGSVVKPYITPDTIDPTLLVGIPRYLNRTQYNIVEDDLPFTGYDTWNCYEFSALTNNGFPVCGVLRCVYPSNSPRIVESKSIKLYLNSFNMHRCGETVDDVIEFVEQKVYDDLSQCIGTDELTLALIISNTSNRSPMYGTFTTLEEVVDVSKVEFNHYNEDPAILKVVKFDTADTEQLDAYHSAVLRSNCRVTNQPDWGDVYVVIRGSKTITPESLLQYIVSMRKENHFHEEICECIYKRLMDLLEPESLLVACLYTRRGGIDINPVRATDDEILHYYADNLVNCSVLNMKTMRQ